MRTIVRRILPKEIRHRISSLKRSRQGRSEFFTAHLLGEKLSVLAADDLSRRWYGKIWTHHNRSEFSELAKHSIPKEGLVFDLGAHQGIVSILLRRLIVPNGCVVSIEMDHLNHAACLKNAQANNETKITCLHAAVGAAEGVIRHTGHSNSQVVTESMLAFLLPSTRVVTIDALCAQYGMPALIYLDIEGAEILALQAADTALKNVDTWFVELHGDAECGKFGGTNATVAKTFEAHGFVLSYAPEEDAHYTSVTTESLTTERGFLIAHRRRQG